jgi:hypothetical protein
VLFIGTQFSNFYTVVDTPAKAARLCVWCLCVWCLRVSMCVVLRRSRVSQPLNLRLCLLRHLGFLTEAHPARCLVCTNTNSNSSPLTPPGETWGTFYPTYGHHHKRMAERRTIPFWKLWFQGSPIDIYLYDETWFRGREFIVYTQSAVGRHPSNTF